MRFTLWGLRRTADGYRLFPAMNIHKDFVEIMEPERNVTRLIITT